MKKEKLTGLASVWKIGGIAMSLLMLLSLAACGGGNNDSNSLKLEVKPELGDLGKYMTIESKEALISLTEFTKDGEPHIKIASTLQIKISEDVAAERGGFDLEATILDANMNEITDFGSYDIEAKYDKGKYYLATGDYRAVMDHSGSKKSWDDEMNAMWEMMRNKGKYIVLKPRYSSAKFVPYKGVASTVSSSEMADAEGVTADDGASASSGGEDWDKILDEYEKYVDKTVALYKKAQAGDISAMTEYASLLESAQSLQEKLENAGSDLSTAQAARLSKIAAKMAKAAM